MSEEQCPRNSQVYHGKYQVDPDGCCAYCGTHLKSIITFHTYGENYLHAVPAWWKQKGWDDRWR